MVFYFILILIFGCPEAYGVCQARDQILSHSCNLCQIPNPVRAWELNLHPSAPKMLPQSHYATGGTHELGILLTY